MKNRGGILEKQKTGVQLLQNKDSYVNLLEKVYILNMASTNDASASSI